MKRTNRLVHCNGISDLLVQHNSHGRIDAVLFLFPSSAQHEAGDSHLFAVDGLHVPGCLASNLASIARSRQLACIPQCIGVTTLKLCDLTKLLKSRAIRDHLLSELSSVVDRRSLVAQIEHPCGELNAEVTQVGWPTTFEDSDAFNDFERIANVQTQRLIHVSDQCNHALADADTSFDHQFGQVKCI